MKKIFFIIMLILLTQFLISCKLSEPKVLGIAKPYIIDYCSKLEVSNCARCAKDVYDFSKYKRVEILSQANVPSYVLSWKLIEGKKYDFNDLDDFYFEVLLPLDYINPGNTGGSIAQFKIDKNGNILSKRIPMTDCKAAS